MKDRKIARSPAREPTVRHTQVFLTDADLPAVRIIVVEAPLRARDLDRRADTAFDHSSVERLDESTSSDRARRLPDDASGAATSFERELVLVLNWGEELSGAVNSPRGELLCRLGIAAAVPTIGLCRVEVGPVADKCGVQGMQE